MAISLIELQGTVARAQDYSAIKHNEDNKTVVNQTNYQNQFNKELDQRMTQVTKSEEVDNMQKRYDAKEKGDGHYDGDGGKRRKKKSDEPEGKVILKNPGGFDMKI